MNVCQGRRPGWFRSWLADALAMPVNDLRKVWPTHRLVECRGFIQHDANVLGLPPLSCPCRLLLKHIACSAVHCKNSVNRSTRYCSVWIQRHRLLRACASNPKLLHIWCNLKAQYRKLIDPAAIPFVAVAVVRSADVFVRQDFVCICDEIKHSPRL